MDLEVQQYDSRGNWVLGSNGAGEIDPFVAEAPGTSEDFFSFWGKPNTRVTSRKVGTVSFVSIADEGRSCGTKTPERARKSKCLGRRCHLVSSNLLSQPL
jgi:hypothetical protein